MKVKTILNTSIAIKTVIRHKGRYYNIDILRKDSDGKWAKPLEVKKYNGFEDHNTYITLPAEVLNANVDFLDVNSVENALVISTK